MTAITKFFIGGEREAFIRGSESSISWTTTAGRFDSNFSRGGVRLAGNTGTTDVIYISCPLTAPQLECYAGLIHFVEGNIAGPSSRTWFTFVNSALTPIYRVMGSGGTPAQPVLRFQYWNGAAWVSTGAGFVVPTDIIHKFDFEFLIADVGGFARCFVDGVLLGALTGDTLIVGDGTIAEMRCHTPSTNGVTNPITVSEVQILDVTTRGRRLYTLGFSADGATTDFSGTYADVDDVGIYSDTDLNDSSVADQVSTFVANDTSGPALDYLVDGIVLAYRAQIGGTGPQNLKGVIRMGGVDYPSAANVTGPTGGLTTAMGYVWADFPENPDTTANFTHAEINTAGFEIGFKSVA